jgi:hypothetical protein
VPIAWRDAVTPVDAHAGLWRLRDGRAWIVAAPGQRPLRPVALHALDDALLQHVARATDAAPNVLVLVEDSRGHEISRTAEELCVSRFLAHHAVVIGALRARNIKIHALLAGQGHSAAFFANALQADSLVAAESGRVMAMDPRAVARVTGLDAQALESCIETDSVLGHSAALFAHCGGVARFVRDVDAAALESLLQA